MNFDEKDIEFFNNFEDEQYDNVLSTVQSINNKLKYLRRHPIINKKSIELVIQETKDFFNPNRMYERLGVDVLWIKCAENLEPMLAPYKNGTLLQETQVLREKLTDAYGFILPNLRISDSNIIEDYGFEIFVLGRKVYNGKISDEDLKNNNSREIIKGLYSVCFDYMHYIMHKTDVLKLIELVRAQDPTLVDDIIPAYVTPLALKHILANLIQRKVGIKDIISVFEILNENIKNTQDINELTSILEKELSFT